MDIFDKYPELKKKIEALYELRRNEILSHMVETDDVYNDLCRKRADTSMAVKLALAGIGADALFEEYSDAVYAQEIYELDAIYRRAFYDTVEILKELGLI